MHWVQSWGRGDGPDGPSVQGCDGPGEVTDRDVDTVREVRDEGVVVAARLTGDVTEYFLRAVEPFYTET